jgi:elongation factor Ts
MQITAEAVKKLRDRTGKQMMTCKAALVEAGGDMDRAVEILRKGDAKMQEKTADRETAEGRIGVYIDPHGEQVGAIVELRCESAPVAKNEMFVKLATDLAKQVAMVGADTPEALLNEPFVDNPSQTVKDRIGEVVGLMRENMKPVRMARFTGGLMGSYVHFTGDVGALVQVEGASANPELLRDVAMHVTAKNPVAALREHVPQDKVAKEMEIARAQAAEQGKGKPANIIEKIAEGKLKTWFAEHVLAEQPFVKDDKKTIAELLKAAGLKLAGFVRYKVGEKS